MGVSFNSSSWRRSLIPVIVILVLACALRTIQYLGRGSFWADELSLALNFQQRSLADLVSQPLGYRQVAPIGFVAAVKAPSALLGVNELALRLGPWIAGCSAVLLFWRVSLRVLSGVALLVALILFAVSPSLIWYSGNVKPYSGDVAATLLLVLFALRFQELPDDRRQAIVAGLAGGLTMFFSFPAVVTAGVLGLILVWWWLRERPQASVLPMLWLTALWASAAVAAGVLALKLTDPETNAQKAAEFYGTRLGFRDWVSAGCHREDPRAYFREIDQFRGRPRVWFFYTHSAPGYREPEVIRSYFRTIGEERDRISDPFDIRGQGEAAAYLYDLSDRKRLATTTWDRHQFPKPTTGALRILCDGTRVGAE